MRKFSKHGTVEGIEYRRVLQANITIEAISNKVHAECKIQAALEFSSNYQFFLEIQVKWSMTDLNQLDHAMF